MKERGNFALVDDGQLAEIVLGGWHTINPILMQLTRGQIAKLILVELRGKRRVVILKRLHQRFCRVRAMEEEIAVLQIVSAMRKFVGEDCETLIGNSANLIWLQQETA